jgi:hypothetical protein
MVLDLEELDIVQELKVSKTLDSAEIFMAEIVQRVMFK